MKFSATLWRSAAVIVLGATGLAAFGTIGPSSRIQPIPEQTALIESLPVNASLMPAPAYYIREERYLRGDTLSGFLARLGIAEAPAVRLVRMRALHQLRPGNHVTAEVSTEGQLLSLGFLVDRDKLVQVAPEGAGYRVSEERVQLETRLTMKSSVIRSSLFAAADVAGIPDSVAIQLADVFAGDSDFYRDLRKNDRFTVVYEEHRFAGRPVRSGRVVAAEFVNQGKTLRAIFHGTSYYTPEGKNLRKAFLRSPLEFSRISSGFGMRVHPIAREWRAHRGIDYAAPAGTRVRSVGDGVVEFVGLKGGYGKTVIVRHRGRYTTLYAHLSRYSPKLRRGTRVAQNDSLGFVGKTGWATGPHLHYEFRIAGKARNPLSIAMPAALPIPANQVAAFRGYAGPLVARLDLLADSSLARLE